MLCKNGQCELHSFPHSLNVLCVRHLLEPSIPSCDELFVVAQFILSHHVPHDVSSASLPFRISCLSHFLAIRIFHDLCGHIHCTFPQSESIGAWPGHATNKQDCTCISYRFTFPTFPPLTLPVFSGTVFVGVLCGSLSLGGVADCSQSGPCQRVLLCAGQPGSPALHHLQGGQWEEGSGRRFYRG